MTNILRGISHTLAAVTSNCSDFETAWQSARNQGLEGHWIGEWHSDVNEHHGELRCVLQQIDENHFRAFANAKYAKFMRVCYTVELRFEQMAECLHLEGEADLGELAGGVYRYDGVLTATEFNCRYECKYDRGAFSLRRSTNKTGSGVS